jgi:SAM-dependent methyltransferase
MDPRIKEIFFEIHKDLPRQGPGDFESTKRAFSMIKDLPGEPRILDIGCGPGMQTLDLTRLTAGSIVAVDNHQPFLDTLSARVREAGLTKRIQVVNGDMASLRFEKSSFDVIWAEGSIYLMGFERGIRDWNSFLRPGGYLAVTEVTWLKPNPPKELKGFWEAEYPAIRDVEENTRTIAGAGCELAGHFTLPESAWWEHYYRPLEKRLPGLRSRYQDDDAALGLIEMEQAEIDLYRKYSDYYGYVFYVMRGKERGLRQRP